MIEIHGNAGNYTTSSYRGNNGDMHKVKIEENKKVSEPFYVFLEDLAEKGKGRLSVSKVNNPHLSY